MWSAEKRNAGGSAPQPFQPPPYLSNLIASINDGAKAAQTGALYFTFIGLYLLAVALSTTDEDFLRERAVAISQLGMVVPVVFSFAVAPLIFLLLHVHTLIRYDMLAANLWQFEAELKSIMCEEDRVRCHHLLANVEFLRYLAAAPGTYLNSRLFHVITWFVIAAFPVMVLLIIQLSSLRYQDQRIVWTQRLALFADLGFLIWFFQRQWRMRHRSEAAIFTYRQVLASQLTRDLFYGLFILLVTFNVAYMGVPGPDAKTVGRKASNTSQQPVDFLCEVLRFGCRYLRVPQMLLLAANADPNVLVRLRTQGGIPATEDLNSIEGLNLRRRKLRFVDLQGSRLYAADLTGTDLRGAYLKGAYLKGVDLSSARLRRATLTHAQLQHANLQKAHLQLADLEDAQLQGADLEDAQLQGANLNGAELQGANLVEVRLQFARLREAQLQGADLRGAELQDADLEDAQLQGASLIRAQLQSANLSGAQLDGAELRNASLWQARFDEYSNLRLGDLRDVSFNEPTDHDRKSIARDINDHSNKDWRQWYKQLLPARRPPAPPLRVQADQSVLISAPLDECWCIIERTMNDVAEFDHLLAPFLVDLAKSDPAVAAGIARRTIEGAESEPERLLYPDLARRLLKSKSTIRLTDVLAAELEPIVAKDEPAQEAAPKARAASHFPLTPSLPREPEREGPAARKGEGERPRSQ
ncbi:MAG: pentapeptide repeat-containing protein [Thauera sp.]